MHRVPAPSGALRPQSLVTLSFARISAFPRFVLFPSALEPTGNPRLELPLTALKPPRALLNAGCAALKPASGALIPAFAALISTFARENVGCAALELPRALLELARAAKKIRARVLETGSGALEIGSGAVEIARASRKFLPWLIRIRVEPMEILCLAAKIAPRRLQLRPCAGRCSPFRKKAPNHKQAGTAKRTRDFHISHGQVPRFASLLRR